MLALICFAILAAVGGNLIQPKALRPFPYTECGGVVPISVYIANFITYKLGEKYDPNEFCVWTLAPQGEIRTVEIEIKYGSETFTDANDGIVAYFWNETAGLTSQKMPRNSTRMPLDALPPFLAFSSDDVYDSASNGFSIWLIVTGSLGVQRGRSYLFNAPEGEYTYPADASEYENNDLVSIVVQGVQGRPIDGPQPSYRHTALKDVDTEPIRDSIAAYTLLPYEMSTNFFEIGRFSGKLPNEIGRSTTNYQFPNVYIFTSDAKITGRGFTVIWKHYSHVEL